MSRREDKTEAAAHDALQSVERLDVDAECKTIVAVRVRPVIGSELSTRQSPVWVKKGNCVELSREACEQLKKSPAFFPYGTKLLIL